MSDDAFITLERALAEGRVDLALEALDRVAHDLHGGRHPLPLVPIVDQLVRLDVSGRPYAALAVAIASRESGVDGPEVEALVESAESAFAASGDDVGSSFCAYLRGNQALVRGDLVAAGYFWRRSMALAPDVAWVEASALTHLALVVYEEEGDLRQASCLIEDALALSRRRNDRRTEAAALVYGAFLELSAGAFGRAEDLLDLAQDVFAELTDDQRPERLLGRIRSRLTTSTRPPTER